MTKYVKKKTKKNGLIFIFYNFFSEKLKKLFENFYEPFYDPKCSVKILALKTYKICISKNLITETVVQCSSLQ